MRNTRKSFAIHREIPLNGDEDNWGFYYFVIHNNFQFHSFYRGAHFVKSQGKRAFL